MNHWTGVMQLVLGVTVVFVVSVNELLDWYHAVSTECNGRIYGQCE